jgi:predicted membrane-bound spermidine synthase
MAASRQRLPALQLVFVVSGFCGLIYESIWSHYLKLFVGHAAYAQTVVLIVFIGGMAIGAGYAGRIAQRLRHPLLAYAIVEGIIGAISLVFHGGFVKLIEWAYESLLPASCVPEVPCAAQWLLAAAMILPQSILLGTTFPLMTTGVLRMSPENPGRRIALFYFLNSIGAVFGVLASGFVLIPAVGLPGTLLTAGLVNFGVALAAYACAKGAGRSVQPLAAGPAHRDGASFVRLMLLVAALTGLSSFVYEIVWIRMLALVVGASTHAFELMLAAFILGLALGGAWVRSRIDRFGNLIAALGIVQVLMGLAAAATVMFYDATFEFLSWLLASISRSEGGYAMYNVASHLLAIAIMLPATFLAGMTLPLITTALLKTQTGESAVGYVYAANTLGAIVGVIIAVHFALPVLGLKYGLVLGAVIDIALGIALLRPTAAAGRALRIGWIVAGIVGVTLVSAFGEISPQRTASGVFRTGNPKLEASSEIVSNVDGKTATVSVTRTPTTLSIRTNGKPDASVALKGDPAPDEFTMALSGLLPLAYNPRIETAAIIGFGSGITTATVLGSPNVKRVDTIEIEPEMVKGARIFGAHSEAAYSDARSHIIIDDAKSYFARSRQKYDLIMSEPSNPWVSGVASLFTVEFYAHAKRQLSDGGLFVQWLQIYEFSDDLFVAILRALDREFTDYAIYAATAGDMIIVASNRALPRQPSDAFVGWPALEARLKRLDLLSVDELEARRIAGASTIRSLLPQLAGGMNSDYFPIVDQAAPKARFLRSSADALSRLVILPVPVVEMLERRDPAATPERLAAASWTGGRRPLFASAETAVEWFEHGKLDGKRAPTGQAALLRAALWNCAPWPSRNGVAQELADVAEAINPQVRPQVAQRVWNGFRNAPCARNLSARDREWLELVDAVGVRDAARMARHGTDMSRAIIDDASQPRYYALLAAVTGLVVEGRREEAARLMNELLGKLPPIQREHPVWKLLRGAATNGSAG